MNWPPWTNYWEVVKNGVTFLQQRTLNIFCQKMENLYNWMDNLWLKVENIVAKGEIVCFEQFLLLSLCFQKAAAAEASESVFMRVKVWKNLKMACQFVHIQGVDIYYFCSQHSLSFPFQCEQILVFVNTFPHTTILQQKTLNIFCQKMENLYEWITYD